MITFVTTINNIKFLEQLAGIQYWYTCSMLCSYKIVILICTNSFFCMTGSIIIHIVQIHPIILIRDMIVIAIKDVINILVSISSYTFNLLWFLFHIILVDCCDSGDWDMHINDYFIVTLTCIDFIHINNCLKCSFKANCTVYYLYQANFVGRQLIICMIKIWSSSSP